MESLYRPSLATLTDLYELTMAAAYYKGGRDRDEAVFSLFFRRPPFGSGFTLAAGLESVVDFIENFAFSPDDLTYLATLSGSDGKPLFEPAFLDHLDHLRLDLDIDAVPEGGVVFPYEPLVRVRGPLLAAQIVETALLNLVNFPSLVATNAARVVRAAAGVPVLEFGLRRAQGPDGALTASRAAYLGGCAATSNVLAGRLFGIPVRGTHAHSWILAHHSEQEAFDAYAEAMPNNAILLVDTYDSLTGVERAILTGRKMRAAGHELGGIRLDSGDLAYLSARARRMLDAAGFPNASIVASNDLDPEAIAAIEDEGGSVSVYGVGTKLVTAYDQPALGGVYKLTAIRANSGEPWRRPIKVSDDPGKVTVPGVIGVRRFSDAEGTAAADMLYDESDAGTSEMVVIDPTNPHRSKVLDPAWSTHELLVPIFRAGRRVYDPPSLTAVRDHAAAEIASFHPGVLRRLNPHRYPAGLEAGLHRRREALIEETRVTVQAAVAARASLS